MTYPTTEDLIEASNLPVWIDRHFLRQDPFAFSQGAHNAFFDFIEECSRELNVDANSIYCIGSGAIGLSFNPSKMAGGELKAFDRSSDLDIAIISPFYFETAWRDLRTAVHPEYANPSRTLQLKIEHQRRRMFDGAIIANKLLSHLSFGPDWLKARQRLQLVWKEKLGISGGLNMWIYRDYWSVRSYSAEGIRKCLTKMKEEQ